MESGLLRRCIVVPAMAAALGLCGCAEFVLSTGAGMAFNRFIDSWQTDGMRFEEKLEQKAARYMRPDAEGRDLTTAGWPVILEIDREFKKDNGLIYVHHVDRYGKVIKGRKPEGNYFTTNGVFVSYGKLCDMMDNWTPTGKNVPVYLKPKVNEINENARKIE